MLSIDLDIFILSINVISSLLLCDENMLCLDRGCKCWVRIPNQKRPKATLPAKATLGRFLGFAQPNFKAYRILLPSGRIEISRDVEFDESAPPHSDTQAEQLLQHMDVPSPAPTSGKSSGTTPISVSPSDTTPAPDVIEPPPRIEENPLFEEEEQQDTGAPVEPALRRSTRVHQPPTWDPYQKYLSGLPGAKTVNFRLPGSSQSP